MIKTFDRKLIKNYKDLCEINNEDIIKINDGNFRDQIDKKII